MDAASGDVAGENQVDDGALESNAESEHEDTVWTITESGALFTVCGESDEHQKTSPVDAEKPLSISISGDKFQDVPAFQMLAKIGLAELPNAVGTGIGNSFYNISMASSLPSGQAEIMCTFFWGNQRQKERFLVRLLC